MGKTQKGLMLLLPLFLLSAWYILQGIFFNLKRGVFFGSKSEKLTDTSESQIPLLPVEEVEAPVTKAAAPVKAHTRAARVKRDLSKLPHFRVDHQFQLLNALVAGRIWVRSEKSS